tara:strand:+ start:118 stop:267 length:150 start_codon:yes stop_codon:yes gene_type:complete
MLRLLKYFFYLLTLAGIVFVAFAYAGPMLGINFTADTKFIELPVRLDVK